MSITTRFGDGGKTALFSGEIVDKDSPRTDAYGDVDELVSILGVARVHCENQEIADILFWIQSELFVVGAELATDTKKHGVLKERIDEERLAVLDAKREVIEARITMPNGFIIPGGTRAAAFIDHARTVARRCERKTVSLARYGMVDNPELIIWLNRLSDFLWLLARDEEGDATILKS